MLANKQISEIKEHLEKAQNPVFFFDNDQDGLCSFLLLRRYIGRGRGVAIKSFPEMNADYFRKATELNCDYIFILDKPIVSQDFFEEVRKINIPVVWIDHHETQSEVPDFVNYYNPLYNKSKGSEPTTALCYQITSRKQDSWIALIGCIADKFIPDFYSDFKKSHPDLAIDSANPFEIFYQSEIGKIARIFGFALKDTTTNVVNMLRFLIKAKSPYEVLDENKNNYSMHKRFKEINEKYQKLIEKAILSKENSDKILIFQYASDTSMSADISNELSYRFPEKIISVIHIKENKANISMRGDGVRRLIAKAIEGFESARGGGHECAVGGQVGLGDVEEFKRRLEELI